MIFGLDKGQTGTLGQHIGYTPPKIGMGIHTGADGRSTQRQLGQTWLAGFNESYGGALTPPTRVVTQARTPTGAGHSGSIK